MLSLSGTSRRNHLKFADVFDWNLLIMATPGRKNSVSEKKASATAVFTRGQLMTAIQDAAANTLTAPHPPFLYRLIDQFQNNQLSDEWRSQVVGSCVDLINQDLATLDRERVFYLLELLAKTELLATSRSIRLAIATYVDARMESPDIGTLDIATALLKTSAPPAKTLAVKWISILRGRMVDAPSWMVMDVLIEMASLVPPGSYSETQFLDDLRLLGTDKAVFEQQFGRRKATISKLLGKTQEVIEGQVLRVVSVRNERDADEVMQKAMRNLETQFISVVHNASRIPN